MKKLFTLFLIIITFTSYAQNPWCVKDDSPKVNKLMNLHENIILNENEEEGCRFLIVLSDPMGFGWISERIEITVDGIDFGSVTLPWGMPYKEEIVFLPSGEIQFLWVGSYSPVHNCFEIYNSFNELIYDSPELLPDFLFFIYQNECPDCLPLTYFEGIYISEIKQVSLSWTAPESEYLESFDIFRNDILLINVSVTTNSYLDDTENLEDGDYKYCVLPVYSFVCNLEDKCFETYISNVGIKNYSSIINIYPNPAINSINISGDIVAEIKIYNNIGQLVLSQSNTNIINVSGFPNGIYVLSVETSAGCTIQKKITINR